MAFLDETGLRKLWAGIKDKLNAKADANHTHALSGSTVTGTLPISKGGTGAATQAAARSGLGLGSLATKSSVDLAGTDATGVLPLSKGGTGATTQANALRSLKALPLAGGEMEAGSKITHPGNSAYWTTGLDGAILRRPDAVSDAGLYYPLVASKTVAGNWAMGTCDNQLQFNYIADADAARKYFLFNSDGNLYWLGGTKQLANGTLGANATATLKSGFDGRIFKNLVVMIRSIANNGDKYSSFVFPAIAGVWGLFLPTSGDYYRAAMTISGSGASMSCSLQLDSNVTGVTAMIYATA